MAEKGLKPVAVNFFKLGGTWDMVFRDGQKIGTGSLDDDTLLEMQTKAGYFTENPQKATIAERKLVVDLYARFQETKADAIDVSEHLASWANDRGEQFGDFVRGPFIPLFSGDSSHLTNSIIAPMVVTLVEKAVREPNKPILGGQGTDTADIALLGPFDVLTFDTNLPPLLLAGANRSHHEAKSDAPRNFIDLAKLAHIDLGSGAFWVFQGNLYKASDFVKIDPEETRAVEAQVTFFSSHRTHESISSILDRSHKLIANRKLHKAPPIEHIVHKITPEKLYDAFEGIYTEDMGNQNSIPSLMSHVYDPKTKAIIVETHSLGNVDNKTRWDLVRAAKMNKLVVDVSRTLIGEATLDYAASLLSANRNPKELEGTGKVIISPHKLSKSMARAVTVRAILEGLDQAQTQRLFDAYAQSRRLT